MISFFAGLSFGIVLVMLTAIRGSDRVQEAYTRGWIEGYAEATSNRMNATSKQKKI